MVRRRRGRGRRAARNLDHTVEPEVDEMLEDPAFRVLTVDRLYWINPYGGDLVEAPFDFREVARGVLRRQRPWEHSRALTLKQVQEIRWSHYLRDRIREEPRLRLFHPGGEWLNPFTGSFVGGVHRVDGKISATTLEQMAGVLAACESAASGSEMLPHEQLTAIVTESLRAEQATGELLERTRGRPGPSADPAAVGTHALEPFGWDDLFGSDSPFDQTPTRNRVGDGVVDAHAILAEAGIDWALHPGFEAASRGCFIEMQATADGRVAIAVVRIQRGGEELVTRLKTELRYLCHQTDGFVTLLEGLVGFVHREFGPEHPVEALLGLCHPRERTMDWAACGAEPAALAMGRRIEDVLLAGNEAPALGPMDWDEWRPHFEPSLVKLEAGTVFAAHGDIYRLPGANGHPIGHRSLLHLVAQLSGERPRDLLTRVMGRLYRHSGRQVKEALPQVGMLAMRLKDRVAHPR